MEPKRKGKSSLWYKARRSIIENPKLSTMEQARLTGCTTSTIARVRRELVEEGVISRYDRTPTYGMHKPKTLSPQEQIEIERTAEKYELEDSDPVTPRELEIILASAIRTTKSANEKAALARAIATLKISSADKRDLGPGPPLERNDYVTRLGSLIYATSKRWDYGVAEEAIAWAKEKSREEDLVRSSDPPAQPVASNGTNGQAGEGDRNPCPPSVGEAQPDAA